MEVKSQIKDWGNSFGIRISKKQAKKLGIHKGETVLLEIKKDEYDVDKFLGICKGAESFQREKEDKY